MLLPTWITRLFGKRRRSQATTRKSRCRPRPSLEELEVRCLLHGTLMDYGSLPDSWKVFLERRQSLLSSQPGNTDFTADNATLSQILGLPGYSPATATWTIGGHYNPSDLYGQPSAG